MRREIDTIVPVAGMFFGVLTFGIACVVAGGRIGAGKDASWCAWLLTLGLFLIIASFASKRSGGRAMASESIDHIRGVVSDFRVGSLTKEQGHAMLKLIDPTIDTKTADSVLG